MTSRRNFIKTGGFGLAALAVGNNVFAKVGAAASTGASPYVSKRPVLSERKFTSKAVEETIIRIKQQIEAPKLAWLFENCFPYTLDTTVKFSIQDGRPDTFVYTGDIPAMWLRDSGAQVWPYVSLCKDDEDLKQLIAGVINKQTKCVLIDPYANAFSDGTQEGEWMSDQTKMKPELWERKWEIDSLCYTVRLAFHYWKTTGDVSIFSDDWRKAASLIVQTFKEQQRKDGKGTYKFQRKTERQLDTLSNDGWGNPVKPVGLIVSSFRPSDDATTYGFLIPSNMFAVLSLKQLAEISRTVTRDEAFANTCIALADEVQTAIDKYATAKHLNYGIVYAFEVDGFGNQLFMDDANVPNLLALPYLGCVKASDSVYRNTRRFVWSNDNPYFFKGAAGEGVGGPHIGYDMIWPMSIILKAMTSSDDAEIKACIRMLRDTDGDEGLMHESFNKDNPKKFTRTGFAWANTLFGELIVKLEREGKIGLLNSIK